MSFGTFTGKGSWFGGPNDSSDSGRMAGGHTTKYPAVAIRLPGKSWRDSRQYLGHYVRVTAPNGRSAVLQIGDLGPNESTGRNVDVTYGGLGKLGYTEGNFPTDQHFKVEYLGPHAATKVSGPVRQVQPNSTNAAGRRVQTGGLTPDQAIVDSLLGQRTSKGLLQSAVARMGSNPATYARTATNGGLSPAIDRPTSGGAVSDMMAEAQRINDAHVPYKWGGGHSGKVLTGKGVTPLDCSGAVSRVLGIPGTVSGALAKWGSPGRGRQVTIWANGEHVLMEINGHFWGTSNSNPGGGAGWIPRSQLGKGYLSRFTPRHPPGL